MKIKHKLFIIPLLTAGIAAAGAVTVYTYNVKEQERLDKVINKHAGVMKRKFKETQFLMDQFKLFSKYGANFSDLERAGFVGHIDRVSWVDGILLFSKVYGFEKFTATLKPAKYVDYKKVSKLTRNKELFISNPLNWKGEMTDDMDWIRLSNFVQSAISSFSYFDRCHMHNLQAGNTYDVNDKYDLSKTTVRFNCDINIYTADPAKRNSSESKKSKKSNFARKKKHNHKKRKKK